MDRRLEQSGIGLPLARTEASGPSFWGSELRESLERVSKCHSLLMHFVALAAASECLIARCTRSMWHGWF